MDFGVLDQKAYFERHMNILQMNVRLAEGGAAKVALDLHRWLIDSGVESRLLYGYGPRVRDNLAASAEIGVDRVTDTLPVLANFASHKLLGWEPFIPTRTNLVRFQEYIRQADIVHLHVVHSYYMSYEWLLRMLWKLNKKVVWTVHDYWVLTGRCAFTDGCKRWQTGCGACPTHVNYPPAMVDLSGHFFKVKRSLIESMSTNLQFVSPARFLANDVKNAYPMVEVTTITNGLEREAEAAIRARPAPKGDFSTKRRPKIIVVANDLSYAGKTSPDIINSLIWDDKCELHLVGKNSPFSGPNIINHGEVRSREKLMSAMADADALLFTSIVDICPLTIIEALCIGTPVIALHSDASQELIDLVGGKTLPSKEAIVELIRNGNFSGLCKFEARMELRERSLAIFSGKRVFEDYLNVYRKVLVDQE